MNSCSATGHCSLPSGSPALPCTDLLVRFWLLRLPTTVLDLFVMVGQLGTTLLEAVAPLDYTLALGNAEGRQICAPTMPCLCKPRSRCVSKRRLEVLSLNATSGHSAPSATSSFAAASLASSAALSADNNGSVALFKAMSDSARAVSDHRRLFTCGWGKRRTFSLTGCCDRRICARSKLGVSGSVRLQVTESTASVELDARVRLQGPGEGLRSIDRTMSARLSVGYGAATSLCDLVPGLKNLAVGSIGGGSTQVCAWGLCINVNLPKTPDIKLYDVLPCDRLVL